MDNQKIMDMYADAERKIAILRNALRACKSDFASISEDVQNHMDSDAVFKCECAESFIDKQLEATK